MIYFNNDIFMIYLNNCLNSFTRPKRIFDIKTENDQFMRYIFYCLPPFNSNI